MRFKTTFLTLIDRFLSGLNAIFTAIPATTLVVFLILAASTRISLGRWPVVYRDNFNHGPINVLVGISIIAVMLLFASFPAWVVTATILIRPEKKKILYSRALLYFVSFAIFILICVLDPTGFFEWFMD
ncbi:hypothetical protein L0244_17630 [bacterium]|nr:hypothetical protein [bacterium]